MNNGTCYTKTDCANRGGVAQGSCASGFGVCCYCKLTWKKMKNWHSWFLHSWVYMWENYNGKWYLLFKSCHTCQNMQLINQPHQWWYLPGSHFLDLFFPWKSAKNMIFRAKNQRYISIQHFWIWLKYEFSRQKLMIHSNSTFLKLPEIWIFLAKNQSFSNFL